MTSLSAFPRNRSRVLITLAYTALLLPPLALMHALVFWLPWSPVHQPELAASLRWNATMLGAGWLFAVAAVATCAGCFVRYRSSRAPDVLFRAFTCSAHAPAGVVWLSRDCITLTTRAERRVVPLADLRRVAVDTRWQNLVGVFLWREHYPVTLVLRDETTLPVFVFAAQAFADAIEAARQRRVAAER